MKNLFYLLALLLFLSCTSTQPKVSSTIPSKQIIDSLNLQLEKSMVALKNIAFIECLYMGEALLEKEYKIDINSLEYKKNQLQDYSLSWFFELAPSTTRFDNHRLKIIERWIKKNYKVIFNEPVDSLPSAELYRAFDFYYSDELNNYIDSVRNIEIFNYKKEYPDFVPTERQLTFDGTKYHLK